MNTPVSAAPGPRALIAFVFLMLAAGALQSSVAGGLRWQNGQPDFPLALALVAAFLSDSTVGCLCGFGAGIISAAIVGETAATYLVTRSLVGWIAGLTTARLYRGNAGVVLLGVLIASVAVEVGYGLSAPRSTVLHGMVWVRSVGFGALWNTLFALPTVALLRLLGWGRRL